LTDTMWTFGEDSKRERKCDKIWNGSFADYIYDIIIVG